MLRGEWPHLLFENGGRVICGNTVPVNPERDLREPSELLANESEVRLDYGGWWFFCVPVERIRRVGLPLPFFLKYDDVEFGCRMGGKILTLNGIGVWHDSFEYKDSQLAAFYFHMRNRLIYFALGPQPSLIARCRFFLTTFAYMVYGIACYRYKNVRLAHEGIADFLKGPDHLFPLSANHLKTLQSSLYPRQKFPTGQRIEECEPIRRLDNGQKILRMLNLVSHILPSFLLRERAMVTGGAAGGSPFLARGAVFYDPRSGEGYEVKRSVWNGFQLFWKSLCHTIRLIIRWPHLRKAYRRAGASYATPDSWRKLLGMQDRQALTSK